MFVSSTYVIIRLNYTYRFLTLSAAYVCYIYRNTWLHYPSGCAILSAAFISKNWQENHWLTLKLWMFNLNCSLSLLALPTQLLRYNAVVKLTNIGSS